METEKVGKRKYSINKDRSLVILKSTLSRLPIYYCYLQEVFEQGIEYISSATIAESLTLNPVQVRKDLASVSTAPGRPKKGFRTEQLLTDMKSYLGYDNFDEAVLVGVGGLGHTLLQYPGFSSYGLDIVAGFDSNEMLHGKRVGGKPVLSMNKFTSFVKRLHISVGIIAVPSPQAQAVADLMVESGIRAIWNFAPTHINLPHGVLIKNENLAASLAVLSYELSRKDQK